MIRKHVVSAVFRRNFSSYFRSPTGYVFIAVFVLLAAVMAFWPDEFFVNNLANLDVLNKYFKFLLIFFIPAVAMNTWAEERKHGTDELLFTLPARDGELLLGKYLAALGIYATSLLFAFTYIFALIYLGSPDYGVVFGTYIGYLFLGGALLAVAMVASLLTSSTTVAFILGALFCAKLVFLDSAGSIVAWARGAGWLASLGVDDPFHEFTSGVLSLQSIFYFGSLTALMLYVNLILLARRHTRTVEPWIHRSARAAAILIAAISLGVLTGRLGWRVDVTQERLHSLTPATKEIVKRVDSARPVYIQAYVSPRVPTEYVETRTTLLSVLRDIAAMGGGRIQLRLVDTEPYSAEAREADERFAIKPGRARQEEDGEEGSEEIFMGVAFTCAGEEVVIPFIHRGVPVEYEVTRSIGTVSGAKRRRVGVAATDAKMFGGFDFQSMNSQGEWMILSELKKQYEVTQVSLDQPVTDTFDCLLVGMPSSLTQPQMDNLLAYLRAGRPALLCDDPLPYWVNPGLSPDQPKPSPGGRNPMMGGQPPGEPKGDLHRFMDQIGLKWPSDQFVGQNWNPHPRFKQLPSEFVFVGEGSGKKDAFNSADAISSKLQEMVLVFAGHVEPRTDLTTLKFTPLLSTSGSSGASLHRSLVLQRNPFMGGFQFNPRRIYAPAGQDLTLAARVEGTIPGAPPGPGPDGIPLGSRPATLKLVFVADLDFIHDNFFDIRRQRYGGLEFDNISFVLNCVDALAGDESYVELRKRRPKHRTLTRVEEQTQTHVKKEAEESKKAEEDAKKELEEAKKKVNDTIAELEKRTDMDINTKAQMLRSLTDVENRRLEMKEKEITDKKETAVKRSRTEKEQSVKVIRKSIKLMAVIFPPIPAILIALIILIQRAAGPKRAA